MVMVAGSGGSAGHSELPILTISLAHHAKPIGVFGLVGPSFTNLYHRSLLSLAAGPWPLPIITAAARRLTIDLGVGVMFAGVAVW